MSKMKADRKPPLAKSPIRLRARRVLRTNSTSLQSSPCSLIKSQKISNHTCDMEESELRPEYRSISCELRALAKMVCDEFGNGESNNDTGEVKSFSANSSPLFERGRFYDEYSARRNDRLKRKKGGESERGEVCKTPYSLGVRAAADYSKRRDEKKLDSVRKSVSAAYSVESSENPRYMLRSMSKENKKPPLPLAAVKNYEKSVLASERKIGARKGRKL